jgi:hypothetical protein
LVVAYASDDLSDDLRGYLEVLQGLPQPVDDIFLPEAGKATFAAMAGAMVVDVFLLLNVASQHASVIGTVHQPT